MVRVKTLQVKERSSVVERLVYTQDVVGSIPTVPTKSECSAVWLAHLLWEQGAAGSNPAWIANIVNRRNR